MDKRRLSIIKPDQKFTKFEEDVIEAASNASQHKEKLIEQRLKEGQIEPETIEIVEPQDNTFTTSSGQWIEQHPLSAVDYLLFIEKSRPPRSVGSSPRSIGRQAAIEWLLQKAYTIDNQPLTAALMDSLNFDIRDFNHLVAELLNIDEEINLHDEADEITESKNFTFEGRRIKRLSIPWRYGLKLQEDMAQGKIASGYSSLFTQFWMIDDQLITDEMMRGIDKNDVGIKLAVIIYQCLEKILF